jgi:hypothetical protein
MKILLSRIRDVANSDDWKGRIDEFQFQLSFCHNILAPRR